ncbi:hypothetical protein [Henriciella aquimarina]|uniref:hypothetical protein n=1 Tax=Henriciella aquimarina TaxID=545261 RepID=UPI0013019DC5|nr:hypothetical protein [Henriciella aquimarina]
MKMIVEIEAETWREGDYFHSREIRKRFKVGPVYVPRFFFKWLAGRLNRKMRRLERT